MLSKVVVCLLVGLDAARGLRRGPLRSDLVLVRGGADSGEASSSSSSAPAETEVDSLFGGSEEAGAVPGGLGDLSGLMDGLGDMGGMGGMTPENMQEYAKMMEQFMDSPMMQEFLNDPEKMEQTRQALLKSPMAAQMMKQVPGFEEIINSKELWQQRMLESKTQFDELKAAKKQATASEQAAADDFDD